MVVVLDLVQDQLKYSELNQKFNLQLHPLDKGLPDETNFDTSFTTIPDGISSDGTPLSVFFQNTSSEGTMIPVSQQTYSNNRVVTDNYFQGCRYRVLEYHLPNHKTSE